MFPVARERADMYVPLSIRKSRIVTWLWRHTDHDSWLNYNIGHRLAGWLP